MTKSYRVRGRVYQVGTVVYDIAHIGTAWRIIQFCPSCIDGKPVALLSTRSGKQETCSVAELPDLYADLSWV